jgi:hypothetical protein
VKPKLEADQICDEILKDDYLKMFEIVMILQGRGQKIKPQKMN